MSTLVLYLVSVVVAIAAAGWFGLATRIMGQTRLILRGDQATAAELAGAARRTVRNMDAAVVAALTVSVMAIFAGAGEVIGDTVVRVGAVLMVLLVLVQFRIVHTGWSQLQRGVTGAGMVPEEAVRARKRMAAGTGAGHALWMLFLVLILWGTLMTGA